MYKRFLLLALVFGTAVLGFSVQLPTAHATTGTPPVVTVGVSTSIQLPVASASVGGTAQAQSGATIASTKWTQTAGPQTATITTPSSLSTGVGGLSVAGTYEFKLTATDSNGLSSSAATQIIVKAAAVSETPPTVSAGTDQTITLPQSSVTVSGTASPVQGDTITSVTWVEQSGPVTVTFTNEHALSTAVGGLTAAGKYVFKFSAKDSNGLTASDNSMSVTVLPAPTSTDQNTTTSPSAYTGQNASSNTVSGRTITLVITPPQTLTMPHNSAVIYGTTTPSFAGWSVVEVSGPTQATIHSAFGNWYIDDMAVGTYVFQAHSSTYGNSLNTYATTTVTVLPDTTKPGDVSFNANNFVPAPSEPFAYGTNTGYYPGTPWLDDGLYDLVQMVGGHAVRTTLPDSYITTYGTDANLPQFQYFANNLGFKGNVVFVGEPSAADQSTTTYNGLRSKLWKGMYDPIWSDGSNGDPINPNNTLAEYIYKLVQSYGPYISYWEIVNEPDYTYAPNTAQSGPTAPNNWWTNMPTPDETPNLDAPVTAYVRVLRVAYEVIKKYYPNAYVCPGGLGYPAYLDAILRYTDNPDGGTVTSQYPLTGGAYMDCLSWHFYSEYNTYAWEGTSAPGNINGFKFERYSDALLTDFERDEGNMETVLQKYGYGSTYPAKEQIVTENGMPSRQQTWNDTGGQALSENYTIKIDVEAQRMGLPQMFTYGLAGQQDPGTSNFGDFNLMQLLYIFDKNNKVLSQPLLSGSGVANITMSSLLYGWKYDASQSAKLDLPSNLDGAAFSQNGQYRYVLWAKTTTDDSEAASGSYSFPSSLGVSSLKRVEWNYSETGAVQTVGPASIALSGSPSFFIPANQSLPPKTTVPEDPSFTGASNTNSSTSGNSSTSSNTGTSSNSNSGGGGGSTVSNTSGNTGSSSSPSSSSSSSLNTSTNNSSVQSVSVTTAVLNVRETPNGKVLGHVTANDTGTVLWSSPATPWEEVSFSNGLSGFVYNTYLKTTTGTTPASATTGSSSSSTSTATENGAAQIIVTTPALHVRSTPNGTILGVAKAGDRGTVISQSSDGSWLEVQFPTYTGYIYKQYTVPVVTPITTSTSTSGTATSSVATTATLVTVNTSKLHVRSTPNGTIIGLVTPSDTGTVLWSSPATPWEEVSFSNGLSGFVYGSYLSNTSPSGSTSASSHDAFAVGSLVVVNTSKLHVRSSPNGTIIGLVTLGEEGSVSAVNGSWVKAAFPNGINGYVSSAYITK